MIKIAHIITGLGAGGAENMLYKLVKYSDKNTYYHEVISLMDEGEIGEYIKAEEIKVHSLNINKKNIIKILLDAKNICKNFDIVNTWLYHADTFGFIVAKILLNKKLIWNIRHSNLDKKANKSRTLRLVKLNSLLSKKIDCITFNSYRALEAHKEIGYYNNNSIVIPNGFELDKFKFSYENRRRIRKELLIKNEERVLVTVGRWDIQKDYFTLLKALNELKKNDIRFRIMMVGTNLDQYNPELNELINNYNLRENILLLGRRVDIPDLLSAADIYISSSLGESFSNAIGEAMACELPCIVTDVGDSRMIVGETGVVVEPKDYLGMAHQIINYMKSPNDGRNANARIRIIDSYEIQAVVKKVENNIFKIHNHRL